MTVESLHSPIIGVERIRACGYTNLYQMIRREMYLYHFGLISFLFLLQVPRLHWDTMQLLCHYTGQSIVFRTPRVSHEEIREIRRRQNLDYG